MLTFAEAALRLPNEAEAETARLAAYPVIGMYVPGRFEEEFYRHGNLPEQLRKLFAPIKASRIDEDLLEELTDKSERLIRTSYLMDDAVQVFYRALAKAGLASGAVHVRRPNSEIVESATVPPEAAALQAIKRLWASDWAFETVLTRLDSAGTIALEARPTYLFLGSAGKPDSRLAHELGHPIALVNEIGLVGLP